MDELRPPTPPIAIEQKFERVCIIIKSLQLYNLNTHVRKQTVLMTVALLSQVNQE